MLNICVYEIKWRDSALSTKCTFQISTKLIFKCYEHFAHHSKVSVLCSLTSGQGYRLACLGERAAICFVFLLPLATQSTLDATDESKVLSTPLGKWD